MTAIVETLRVEQEFVTLDLLLFRRFGARYSGLVEATLDRNRDAAYAGPFLPVGTLIEVTIPDPSDPRPVRVIRLFD